MIPLFHIILLETCISVLIRGGFKLYVIIDILPKLNTFYR